MRRILSGAAATAAVLALTGCSRGTSTAQAPAVPREWMATDALNVTGGLFLIVAAALFILSAIHYYQVGAYEEFKPTTWKLLYGGFGCIALSIILWAASAWMAVGG